MFAFSLLEKIPVHVVIIEWHFVSFLRWPAETHNQRCPPYRDKAANGDAQALYF